MNRPRHDLPVLVFDLDGTLSDPAVGIGRSLNHALEAHGFSAIPDASVTRFIGPPLDVAFRSLLGEPSPEAVSRLVATYRERYAEVGFAENVLYPGIPEALAALGGRGHRLGVCTSKRIDFAEKILEWFGLRSRFEFVNGGDVGVSKGRQLQGLLADGAIGGDAVMIGDRAVDVAAAKANRLASVGVLWGHGSREELMDAGADRLLTKVKELGGMSIPAV